MKLALHLIAPIAALGLIALCLCRKRRCSEKSIGRISNDGKLLLVGIPILAVLVALGVAYHFVVVDTDTAARWYVQVDNARVQPPGRTPTNTNTASMPTTKTAIGDVGS